MNWFILLFQSSVIFFSYSCQKTNPSTFKSSSELFSLGTVDIRQVEGRLNPNDQTVSFYYLADNGESYPFQSMFSESIYGLHRSPDYDDLVYKNINVGEMRNGRISMCDFQTHKIERFYKACDVNFLVSFDESGDKIETAYWMDIGLAKPPGSNKILSTKVTIEDYAQNQINQYSTGTCAYNAANGIFEILYAIKNGVREAFSDPFFLAYAPEFTAETSWWWEMFQNAPLETQNLLSHRDMPYSSIYPGRSFSAAKSAAISWFENRGGNQSRINFQVDPEVIFFKAHYDTSRNNLIIDGRATSQEFDDVVAWFNQNHMPVNLHHLVGSVWHSVILIGYDPESDYILVKDSLGQTNLKGTWKSKDWFLRWGYGAIAINLND